MYTAHVRTRPAGLAPLAILLLIACVVGILPLLGVASLLARAHGVSLRDAIPNGPLLARSCSIALLIAVVCTLIALPVAWFVRGRGTRAGLILITPMLLPSYLAYAGWGLLRAPGTWLGNLILKGPGGEPGGNWYPQFAANVQAIAGLVLWAWPLAALTLSVRLRRIDRSTIDAVRLDATGPIRRALALGALCRGAIVASVVLVTLVMLGSAIPLHVAQLDTYAIHLWRLLDETPHNEQARVWLASWPTLAIALGGALVVSRAIDAIGPDEQPDGGRGAAGTRVVGLWSAAVWALSVVAPVVLFALNLREASVLRTFWSLSRGAILTSTLLAGAVSGVSMLVCAAAWMAWSSRRARPVLWALQVGAIAAGLAPGVLIGAATRSTWNAIDAGWAHVVGDSWAVVLCAHVARFGFLPLVAGVTLGRTEAPALVDLRRSDAGGSVRGWAWAAGRPALAVLAGVALACGCLSFHEIESAVMLEPPSASGGSFARVMLQQLHFNRTNELAAGVLITFAGSLALAGSAGVLLRRQ